MKTNSARVVEVVYNWPAETFIQRHVEALDAVQLPVQVIARHAAESLSENASLGGVNANIHAEIMPNFDHLSGAGKIFSLRFLTGSSIRDRRATSLSEKTILGYFERLQPVLIHFHHASLAALMRWIPVTLGIPYTLSLRGSDVHSLGLQSEAQREVTLSAIRGAAKVHAVCRGLGQSVGHFLGNDFDFSVIYTALYVPSNLQPWKRSSGDTQIHFVSSGRLIWMKGFDHLLMAIDLLRKQSVEARLTIVGVGPELDHLLYLRKMFDLENVVSFPGKLDYRQIQNLFSSADAYVQSSLAEGLSNSVAEAMANGLPVFATNVGGTAEVIEDGVTGFLLSPLAPQEWAEKLLQVRDMALLQRVRRNAYERARQFFSAEHHGCSFAAFFEDAVTQKH